MRRGRDASCRPCREDLASADGGEAPVAHRVLARLGNLAAPRAERRVEEQRVVAEAAGPARRARDDALDDALDEGFPAARLGERDEAPEAGGASRRRHPAKRGEERIAPARVVEAGPAVAGGD